MARPGRLRPATTNPNPHGSLFEMNGERFRFRESMKPKKGRKSE
jgi:hypothetical protein